MIRILNIDKSTGVFDVPSFLLTENEELSILFKFTEDVKIGKYFVIARHGTAKKQIFSLNADMTIQLPAAWIDYVELFIESEEGKKTSEDK